VEKGRARQIEITTEWKKEIGINSKKQKQSKRQIKI
jgi:hypothetical protein